MLINNPTKMMSYFSIKTRRMQTEESSLSGERHIRAIKVQILTPNRMGPKSSYSYYKIIWMIRYINNTKICVSR